MGLLFSVIIVSVCVLELLAIYSNFRRLFEPSNSSRDLSPLIRRYEEGLYKERRRIINILEKYKKTENALSPPAELDVSLEPTVELKDSHSIPMITYSDVCNDIHKKRYNNDAITKVDTFDSINYWSNSALLKKSKDKNRSRSKARRKRVKFGESTEEDELDWSRTPSPIWTNKNLETVDNNNYLTQTEALDKFHFALNTEEEAWNVHKKAASSDEDESKPFYELQFLQTLDGVKNKSFTKDFSLVSNSELSWNPNKVVLSSDEDGDFVHSAKKSHCVRKKKKFSSVEIKLKNVELPCSSTHDDLVENVNENAVVDESIKQNNSAAKAFWLIFSGEYTKAMNKDWHGQHFCCWQCDESLTGQRYVLRDEHPYCVACYESVFANSCEKCSRTIGIDSKDLSYKDKHWHEACFLCATCGDSLVDKQFGSKGERIYCGRCYDEQFASRCDGCGQIFRAGTKKMEYKTRQWHEKCFCCNVCKVPIGTQSFIPREQEIYCAKCYEEKYATRCIKCNKVITSGGVTYKNEPWHRECFTCTNCDTSLAGARFTSRDDKPFCAECFGNLFAKRCTACNKPITGIGGTKFISFEDRHWHNDCFFCASCRTSLVGRGFITDEKDIICPECAKKNLS